MDKVKGLMYYWPLQLTGLRHNVMRLNKNECIGPILGVYIGNLKINTLKLELTNFQELIVISTSFAFQQSCSKRRTT